ncbi:MAG TPA: DMT family transporter [Alphaproteobacteria bacterium]|nr:DMT family transporter [Alphaproteobacteria bacterium]
MSRRQAFLILAVLIIIWGMNWSVMKIGLQAIPPLWFAALRMAMGAPCLLLALLLTRRRIRLPGAQDLPVLLSVGLVQMAWFLALCNMGLRYVPAGRSAVLAYTTPIWVTPAAAFFLRERLSPAKLCGVLLGLAGIAALSNPFGFDWSNRAVVLGNGLLMLGAFGWALSIVHVRGHRWHATPLDLAPWQMLVAIVPLAILAYAVEGIPHIAWSPAVVGVLVYNGPIATAFAYWASVAVSKTLPAITTSLGLLGVPITGALVSALTLGEPLTLSLLLGLALIVGGVVLMLLADRRAVRAA